MTAIAFTVALLLAVQSVQPYILLTANMADVQSVAQQLAASPVVDQIGKIWRRAATHFNRQMEKSARKRASRDDTAENIDPDENAKMARRRASEYDDLVALGKDASLYLKSMKKFFDGDVIEEKKPK